MILKPLPANDFRLVKIENRRNLSRQNSVPARQNATRPPSRKVCINPPLPSGQQSLTSSRTAASPWAAIS